MPCVGTWVISMNFAIHSILHPTDFSDISGAAFSHALRIALANRSKLKLLHIVKRDDDPGSSFPNVRRLLVQWGLLGEEDPSSKISADLGVEVENVRFKGDTAASGIVEYLSKTPCDLVVLSTHGRDGVDHWLHGSVSEAVFRSSAIPTLFITRGARGFVSQVSGDIQLRRVLVPIDFSPMPSQAIERIDHFGRLLGEKILVHLVHVGSSAPPVHAASGDAAPPLVILRFGNIVKSIVDAAIEYDVDFIGMPTAGHHGVLDALRGSTTERVIRHAPCPVLAIPVG
jgi:nucleotide-binding universal stress UspA family protein